MAGKTGRARPTARVRGARCAPRTASHRTRRHTPFRAGALLVAAALAIAAAAAGVASPSIAAAVVRQPRPATLTPPTTLRPAATTTTTTTTSTTRPAPPTTAPPAAPTAFIRRNGTTLTLGGVPIRLVGTNDWQLGSVPYAGGSTCFAALDTAGLDASLADLQRQGATTVRVLFPQLAVANANAAAFDTVVARAGARGLRIIPVLTNQWGACDTPSGQPVVRKDLTWYRSGYRMPGPYRVAYRDYAVQLAARYANSPTIAFWQLVNEAEAPNAAGVCTESAASAALRAFADDVATAIKAVDPNHLVSLGTIGGGQCGTAGSASYRYVHAGAVDLCEYHDYANPLAPIPGDRWNGLAVRLDDCRSLNKPIFVGEAGIDARTTSTGTIDRTPHLDVRARLVDAKLQAQFAAGVVGYLSWMHCTAPIPSAADYCVLPGDPLGAVMARYR